MMQGKLIIMKSAGPREGLSEIGRASGGPVGSDKQQGLTGSSRQLALADPDRIGLFNPGRIGSWPIRLAYPTWPRQALLPIRQALLLIHAYIMDTYIHPHLNIEELGGLAGIYTYIHRGG